MRKATGKVVSLVLALALVVTSFSSTFAFAATKSETADVVLNAPGDVTLVNLSDVADSAVDLATAKENNEDKFNITEHISAAGVELETYDHIVINPVEISSISVRGDNIIRIAKDEQGNYIATVRSATGTGTATVNVLYTGTTTDRGEDEITVRGSASFTVTLLDAKTPYFTGVSDLQKNPDGSVQVPKNPDNADAKAEETVVNTGAKFVLPKRGTATAEIGYEDPQNLIVAEDYKYIDYNANKGGVANVYDSAAKVYNVDESEAANTYVITATGTNNYMNVKDDNTITYGVVDPSVGNTIRLNVYSLREVKDSKGAHLGYTTNRSVAQASARVQNMIKGDFSNVELGDGSQANVGLNAKPTVLSKSKPYVKIGDKYWDATNADLYPNKGLIVSDGRVGDIYANDDVEIADGTVGNVYTTGDVDVLGGTVGTIGDLWVGVKHYALGNVTVSGATVAAISGAVDVSIDEGTVSGAISATSVSLVPANEEVSVSVGTVSAKTLVIDGSVSNATAAGYFATSADESALTLIGSKARVNGIDDDWRDAEVVLVNFNGTVPAIKNGEYTGYEETGATLTTDDTDTENATAATVNGDLNIRNIELNSGEVTFTGKVVVNNVYGSEATMVINAGALRVTESVATSNVLKLAGSTITPGTVVYQASADIAEPESFTGYGFTMAKTTGSTYDTFTVDQTSFAGLQITLNGAAVNAIDVVNGETVTVNAVAYPTGSALPEGTKVNFYLDSDENYLAGENLGNGVATITAKNYSEDFDVLNKGTLTAVVEDDFGMILEEYGEAKVAVTVIPVAASTYASDTTGYVDIAQGNTYQFKITSLDGNVPNFGIGNSNAIALVSQSQEGNNYFFKVQAIGQVGDEVGIYINRDANKVATMRITEGDATAAYTCDTTAVNVAAGASYQVEITAAAQPTLAAGNPSYTVEFVQRNGNNYYFRITAATAKAGDQVGFYINGGARAFVATTV